MRRLLLLALSFIGLSLSHAALAQSDNTYCYVTSAASGCVDSKEAAEAAMKAALPASYRSVLQPKTPVPTGNALTSAGLEQWRIDYFIPDQPPATTYPATHGVSGWNAAAGICAPSNDPLDPDGCLDGDAAALAMYQQMKNNNPSCSFVPVGFQGAYASPFSLIAGQPTGPYGTKRYTPNNYYATRQYAYTIWCSGWGVETPPDTRYLYIAKRQTFVCPVEFHPVDGYSALSESPTGAGNIVSDAFCRPAQAMPYILFYQRGAPTCNTAGALPDSNSRESQPGPCHPANGDKSRTETDFQFSSLPFSRYYHSLRQTGMLPAFAPGWTHSFSDRVLDGGSVSMRVIRGDGLIEYFLPVGTNRWKSSLSTRKRLVKLGDGSFILFDESGVVQKFNAAGRLVREEHNLAGLHAIDFTYNGDQLVLAQDQTGRALTFNYVANRLDNIQLPDGTTVQYQYDANGNFWKALYPDGTNKQYHYNEPGLVGADDPNALTGITVEDGHRYASYGYTATGRVNLSARHKGDGTLVEQTTIAYPDINHPVVTLPWGETVTYDLVDDGPYRRTTTMTSGGGGVYRIYTGTGGGPSQTISLMGNVTKFEYTEDFLSSSYEAAGTPDERKYVTQRDANYRTTTRTTQAKSGTAYVDKRTLSFVYNGRAQLQTATATDPAAVPALSRTSTLTYCEQTDVTAGTCPYIGLLKKVDGPRTDVADVTTLTYYTSDPPGCLPASTDCAHRKGDLQQVTNALGKSVQYLAYDGMGRPLMVIDQNGVMIQFEYDVRGRLTAHKIRGTNDAVETDDMITRIEYWSTGLTKKVTLPDGSFTTYAYDDAHRLTGIADNAGNTIAYTVNSASERTREDTKDAGGVLRRTLSRTFDAVGRLQSVIDAYGRSTAISYDAGGNPDKITDPLTRVEDDNYDGLSRLTRTLQDMNGIAAETKFTYDTLDNLVQVNDPKLLNTTYTYNGLSDLKQLVSPDTGTTTYTYDSAGNRASRTDARSKVANYAYDALNRPTAISYPTASTLNTTYTWDTTQAACQTGETFTAGRLAKIVDGSGNTVYCYDRFGHVVRKVQTTNAIAFTLRYTWNAAGQLTSTIYPDGAVVDYVYGTQGRVSEIGAKTSTGTRQVLLTNVSYHPFGPAASWRYGSATGRLLNRTLNQNYQPGIVQDTATGGLSIGYEFDEVGNLKKLRDGNQSEPPQRIFGYDGLNRLTQTQDGSTSAVLQGYAYDKTGNRTSATVSGTTTSYTYPGTSHRLSQVGTSTRAYDFNGNTTSVPAGAITKNFVYGDHNRMTQYKEGTTVKMNYVYNGHGEQVRKYLSTTNTYTMYDEAGHWIGNYANAGAAAPVQQAIWFGGLPVGLFTGAGASQKVFHVQPDALGTPRVVIDPTRGTNGTTVWKWDLNGEAFGTTAPNQDPDGDATQFVFDLRFPGQRYDSASGLNYNYFRDYEAATGRYAESDPIGLGGGTATYSYAASKPLANSDPHGLETWCGMPDGTVGPCAAKPPSGESAYIGWEFFFPNRGRPGFGGGQTWLSCTDECGVPHLYKYTKICSSVFPGAGISFGKVSGMSGKNCKQPERYAGPFAEFGYTFPMFIGVGGDIGLSDEGRPTGVNEVGSGLGIPGPKGSYCYYVLSSGK